MESGTAADEASPHALSAFVFPQGYQFEEDNPCLSHPDPLSEGVKRMEAGDIPGAVRFFESAVQREPDNQLVRALRLVIYDYLSLLFSFY